MITFAPEKCKIVMKKRFLLMSFAVALSQQLFSQDMSADDFYRGIYVGVNGGFNLPTKDSNLSEMFNQINGIGGLRVGCNLTPVWGAALEWTAAFGTRPYADFSHTFIKHTDLTLMGTMDVMNLIKSYSGRPQLFSVELVAGLGLGNYYGVTDLSGASLKMSSFNTKVGLDFSLNLGNRSEWQVYLEPSITCALSSSGYEHYDISKTMLGLMVGVNYRLPYFESKTKQPKKPKVEKYVQREPVVVREKQLPTVKHVQEPATQQQTAAMQQKSKETPQQVPATPIAKASQQQPAVTQQQPKETPKQVVATPVQQNITSQVATRSQEKIDSLNRQLDELKRNLNTQTGKAANQERIIDELRAEIDELKSSNTTTPTVIADQDGEGTLLPASLVFLRGHSAVEPQHHDAISMVVNYMENHPTARLLIKGYAVSEGGKGANQRIAEARAQAVKDIMVHRYRIKESRLETKAIVENGAEENFDFNRIVTFTDITR